MKYRKKPIIIEAIQYTGDNHNEIRDFCPVIIVDFDSRPRPCFELYVHTLEGEMHLSKGDYLIKGVFGEFYPCKPEVFHNTYEPVE